MEPPQTATAGPRVRGAGGVEIATYHLGGDGPPLVLVHATGLHGRTWIPLASTLRADFSVWAIDQRGHGSSGKAPGGKYDDWEPFVDDLMAVLDAISAGIWRGVGHSLGGAVLLMAEAGRPGTFASICCYEPVVFPVDYFSDVGPERPVPLAELARKRRPSFPSRQAAYENYASKPPFARFDPAALDAYVTYGFVDEPGGSVTLACAREDEASVFEGAPSNPAWERLPQVKCPVTVFGGGDPTDPVGRVVEVVASRLPRGTAVRFDDLDHFGPLVDPYRVGTAMAASLRATPIHQARHTS